MSIYRVASVGATIDAVVDVPGSKSIANRALVCAALAEGESRLCNVPAGDDTEAMLACLSEMGLEIERESAHTADGTIRIVGGVSQFRPGPTTLHAGLAGTTARFLTAVSALASGPHTIDGDQPLRTRPMAPLHDAMVSLGASVRVGAAAGHLPVTIEGPFDLSVDEVTLRGDVSSQYLTALMLVAPYFRDGLRLSLSTPLVSRPYVRMTARVMEAFGVAGVEVGDRIIVVPRGRYVATSFLIEPDASSAGYPLAAAAICGGRVRVSGLTPDSIQGDAAFCHVLERMGCTVAQTHEGTTVSRGGSLSGLTIDMADLSDLVPTLAAVAVFADSPTEIHGVGFIRNKESDRLGDLCAELRRAGIDAVESADGLVVHPGHVHMATLATHDDHRLAMAFALVGLGAGGIAVENPDVVNKSWPAFWSMIESLR
ncbi:MAG: 3-phosphoshikimate 1-carboxyvinyltransferase [Actinobacteria bacterium]|nr:3-phosphoshikimate 1-carboxyvinyltransferase [Actinomycetota bacterium]